MRSCNYECKILLLIFEYLEVWFLFKVDFNPLPNKLIHITAYEDNRNCAFEITHDAKIVVYAGGS